MTIGFDGSRAFGVSRTGTENYSYQLLKALSKFDTENKYLVYIRPGCHPERSEGSQDFQPKVDHPLDESRDSSGPLAHRNDRGVNSYNWPANFKFIEVKMPRLWTQVGLALRTFVDPLDVLFVPAHTLPLLRRPGLKTVMTVHDLGAEYLPKMHQLKQRLYLSFITKVQLKSATKLIAVSKSTKEDLVKKIGVEPLKVEVIYEAVSQDQFKEIKGDLLRNRLIQLGLGEGKYFLFVGTIQPRKNLERLIKAFSSVILEGSANRRRPIGSIKDSISPSGFQNDEDLKLVLVGAKGWLSDEIYKLPQKLEIEDKVKFLGRVEDKDLPVLYSGAIGLVFPSLFEGFGLPILEAFSCGCPVVTSNLSSMKEVAGNAAILVDPNSVGSIKEGMIKVMSPELRTKLKRKGKERVENFSWEKAARETLKVLVYDER